VLATVTSGLIIIGVDPLWNDVVVGSLIAVAAAAQAFGRNDARAS
jgi:predicted ABC-type sugar transport system permease subunit